MEQPVSVLGRNFFLFRHGRHHIGGGHPGGFFTPHAATAFTSPGRCLGCPQRACPSVCARVPSAPHARADWRGGRRRRRQCRRRRRAVLQLAGTDRPPAAAADRDTPANVLKRAGAQKPGQSRATRMHTGPWGSSALLVPSIHRLSTRGPSREPARAMAAAGPAAPAAQRGPSAPGVSSAARVEYATAGQCAVRPEPALVQRRCHCLPPPRAACSVDFLPPPSPPSAPCSTDLCACAVARVEAGEGSCKGCLCGGLCTTCACGGAAYSIQPPCPSACSAAKLHLFVRRAPGS